MLRVAVTAGLGMTLVAPFNIDQELRTGAVVPLLRNFQTPEFSIAAVYPHRRYMPAKVRVFIDALARRFAGRDWLNREAAALPQ
jgi:DNA-binding transcriptional LysR family regulator